MHKTSLLLPLFLFCCTAQMTSASSSPAAENAYLYRVNLVQAAPGKLVELIDLYKARAAEMKEAGDEAPLWMRHSQGDHWDLMILFPMGSYADYYQPERIAKRARADQTAKLEDKIKGEHRMAGRSVCLRSAAGRCAQGFCRRSVLSRRDVRLAARQIRRPI